MSFAANRVFDAAIRRVIIELLVLESHQFEDAFVTLQELVLQAND